ncbi:MAG TPA: twin-arginine translocation pathway signal, partial [Bauldia sp.]|nr:twin-arginine translocation pathway signal [Bauldia sp.]
ADDGDDIDNMEGLAARPGPNGETLLTLISDDNQSLLQRTVLLQFALPAP